MQRFAADLKGVIATHRGRARFAKPAKGLFFGDLCRQWAVVYGWKCNVFSRIFNIVSAILVTEWDEWRQKIDSRESCFWYKMGLCA